MTARLHRLTNGRLRVYWLTHGQRTTRIAQLAALIAIWLSVSHFDYQDQLNAERAAHAAAAEELRQERAARALPRTVFIIEGKTKEAAALTLANIGSDADAMRYEMRRK